MSRTKEIPRRRGRPPAGDDANLREQLLEAAERLFTRHGYAATPVRAVAEAAEANPALVNYYFGGKHGLLEAVFERALEPMAEAMQALLENPEGSPLALLDLVYGLADEHPNLLPLLVREALLPGGNLREAFAIRFAPRLGGRIPELVRQAQRRGDLSEDADPEALTVLLLAMVVFPLVAGSLTERVIGVAPVGDGRDRIRAQIQRLLKHGVIAS